jgi:hypothetical protein
MEIYPLTNFPSDKMSLELASMETRHYSHHPLRSFDLRNIPRPDPRSEHFDIIDCIRGQIHKNRRPDRILPFGRWHCWHTVRSIG